MDVLAASEKFGRRPESDRSALDVDVLVNLPKGEADCWPAAATAAVIMAGANFLEDAKTDADLDEGLRHFAFLREEKIISDTDWHYQTAGVIDTICAYCAKLG